MKPTRSSMLWGLLLVGRSSYPLINSKMWTKLGTSNGEIFNKAFLDRFFPREKRESKVVEFINLLQGGMSVLEYSLKFTKLSKYDPSLVSDPRVEMSRFVKGVLDDFKEECHSALLHDNMNTYCIMVHAEKVEEIRAKIKSRDAKRARFF